MEEIGKKGKDRVKKDNKGMNRNVFPRPFPHDPLNTLALTLTQLIILLLLLLVL